MMLLQRNRKQEKWTSATGSYAYSYVQGKEVFWDALDREIVERNGQVSSINSNKGI